MQPLTRVDAIIVHHTASPVATTTYADVERWHRERGFEGVGYHRLITWDPATDRATVHLGRPDRYQGAHALNGWNARSLGVCVAGSFEETGWYGMPVVLRRALVETVRDLLEEHGLTPDDVLGHGEAHPGHTVCPGYDPAELRAALRSSAPVPPPSLSSASPPTGGREPRRKRDRPLEWLDALYSLLPRAR